MECHLMKQFCLYPSYFSFKFQHQTHVNYFNLMTEQAHVINLPNQVLGCFRQGMLIEKHQLVFDQLKCSYTSLFVYKLPNSGVDLQPLVVLLPVPYSFL